jgi:hypothetical protein
LRFLGASADDKAKKAEREGHPFADFHGGMGAGSTVGGGRSLWRKRERIA